MSGSIVNTAVDVPLSQTLILRDGAIVADAWQTVSDDAALPSAVAADGGVIVSLGRLRRDRAALQALRHGVKLGNEEDVSSLAEELRDLPLIALDWPKSADGRAYTQARLLRERLGFRGELRATGEVIADQIQAMQRCGINAFVPRADQNLETCLQVARAFDLAYQHAADSLPNVWALRRARA